jgi:hypothetical protein
VVIWYLAVRSATEEYNGTSWSTSPGSLNTAKIRIMQEVQELKQQLCFWWFYGPPVTNATEEYDGTTWTNSNYLNTARRYLAGVVLQTAALAFGGALHL